ncbi:MAG: DinB family protein, partial [Gemmatimonadaceae bacterium]
MRCRPLALALAAALVVAIPPRDVQAQTTMDAKSATFLHQQYLADMDSVHAKVMALATAIPADKYSWRPQTGVRSVGEVLGHLAGEWYYYLPQSVAGKPAPEYAS